MIHSILGVAYRNTSQLDKAIECTGQVARLSGSRRATSAASARRSTTSPPSTSTAARSTAPWPRRARRWPSPASCKTAPRSRGALTTSGSRTRWPAGSTRRWPPSASRSRSRWSARTTRALGNRLNKIADVYRLMGQYDDAMVYLEQAKTTLAQSEEVEEKAINLQLHRARCAGPGPLRPGAGGLPGGAAALQGDRAGDGRGDDITTWPRSTGAGPLCGRPGGHPAERRHLPAARGRARHRRGPGAPRAATLLQPLSGRPTRRRRSCSRTLRSSPATRTPALRFRCGSGRPSCCACVAGRRTRPGRWSRPSRSRRAAGTRSTASRQASHSRSWRLAQGNTAEAAALATRARADAARLGLRPPEADALVTLAAAQARGRAAEARNSALDAISLAEAIRRGGRRCCGRAQRSRGRSTRSAAATRPRTQGRARSPTSTGSRRQPEAPARRRLHGPPRRADVSRRVLRPTRQGRSRIRGGGAARLPPCPGQDRGALATSGCCSTCGARTRIPRPACAAANRLSAWN